MERSAIDISEKYKGADFKKLLKIYGFNGLIPSNCIIDKVRPGIGATTAEIESSRHSIIVEPFVTVLDVKKTRYAEKLCIVMEGVHNKDIEDYLNDSTIAFKKIMTTPEGFDRMIRTLANYDSHYRKNFFLLCDESDKLIEDCLFRNKILSPLCEFFEFEQKAFISATPIIPSDPRLEEQQFKHLIFKPTWDYRTHLKLITTDNIRTSLRNHLALLRDNKPLFIFTNCKQTILYLSRLEEVKFDYRIFCSEELEEKFFSYENTENVYNSVRDQQYARFNIFTSRFFSAVDMIYKGKDKPHIIMVTNLPSIKHSIINPYTSAIQIHGRCRKGVSSVTHITTLYRSKAYKPELEIKSELDFATKLINKLRRSALAFMHKSVQVVVDELIGKEFAKAVYNSNGNINPYFRDAFLNRETVSNLYTDFGLLKNAYEDTNYFKVEHINVWHMFTDDDLLAMDTLKNRKRLKLIANKLAELEERMEAGYAVDKDDLKSFERLIDKETILFDLYCYGGLAFLEQLRFQRAKMRKAFFNLKLNLRNNNISNMHDEILLTFPLNRRLNSDYIKSALNDIYIRGILL